MSEITETKAAPPSRLSFEVWAVAVSLVFIALIVAGIFPRVPW